VLANALFGTYLSQILWAQAVLLTSPLIATCALTLTIPIALAADVVFRGASFDLTFALGGGAIIGGFLLISVPGCRGIPRTPRRRPAGSGGASIMKLVAQV
jgi:solute carrier family 35 protein F5